MLILTTSLVEVYRYITQALQLIEAVVAAGVEVDKTFDMYLLATSNGENGKP